MARHRAVEPRFHRLRLALEMAGEPVIDLGDHIGSDRRIDRGRRDDIDARDVRAMIASQRGRRAEKGVEPIQLIERDENRLERHLHHRADLPGHEFVVAIAELSDLERSPEATFRTCSKISWPFAGDRHAVENIAAIDVHIVDHPL